MDLSLTLEIVHIYFVDNFFAIANKRQTSSHNSNKIGLETKRHRGAKTIKSKAKGVIHP
jgi:hypothetical protein